MKVPTLREFLKPVQRVPRHVMPARRYLKFAETVVDRLDQSREGVQVAVVLLSDGPGIRSVRTLDACVRRGARLVGVYVSGFRGAVVSAQEIARDIEAAEMERKS